MAQEVVGSILLACRSGRSNKEYLVEVLEDFDQNTAKQMVARYGPSGRLGGLKEYGSYSSNDANKLIESKLKKAKINVRALEELMPQAFGRLWEDVLAIAM